MIRVRDEGRTPGLQATQGRGLSPGAQILRSSTHSGTPRSRSHLLGREAVEEEEHVLQKEQADEDE